MGLKRIMAVIEVTYPADDSRSLDTLTSVTAQAVSDGVLAQNGMLARIGISGAAIDPDPEPTAPEEPLPVMESTEDELDELDEKEAAELSAEMQELSSDG